MSPEGHTESGIPRSRRAVPRPTGGGPREETWPGANKEKTEKLRVRSLTRRVVARGFGLRHSEYGYALIDPTHQRIDDRSDLTLNEVESWLKQAPE